MPYRLFTLCLLLAGLSLPSFGASLTGNNQPITSGDTTPDTADGTDFGRVFIGSEFAHEFTHRNNNGLIENPNTVSITGGDTADFTVQATYPGVIVRFAPKSAGPKTAVISVGVTNPITFTVAGRCDIDAAVWTETFDAFGVIPPGWESSSGWFNASNPFGFSGRGLMTSSSSPGATKALVSPPIAVQHRSLLRYTQIASLDSGNTPSVIALEYQQAGETIWNPVPLSAFTGGYSGTGNGTFGSQTLNVDLSFAAGQTISVRWRFSAGSGFGFTQDYWYIDGVSLHELSDADFTLAGNSEVIYNGDTTPRADDDTDFGNTSISSTTTHTFTVNYFSSVLPSFRGTPTVSITGPDAASFSVVGSGVLSAAGPTATFQVAFSPTSLGRKNATISIAKSANGPPHFTCSISGTAAEVLTFFNETFSDEDDGFDVTGWTRSISTFGWAWNESEDSSLLGSNYPVPAGVFYTAESNQTLPTGHVHTLDSPEIVVRKGSILSFDHDYAFGTNQGNSSAALDYSVDGGVTWLPVPEEAIEGGYPDDMNPASAVYPFYGRPVWWGSRFFGLPPETVRVHLDSFASGKNVRIRWIQANGALPVFRFWWIDNVKVTAPLPTVFDVKGNGAIIASGDDTPSEADHTDFGPLQGSNGAFTPRTRSFSITSIPALPTPLPLPADFEITITGPDAADFRIEGLTTTGDPRTFSVVFDPKSMGDKSAVVNVSGGGTTHSFTVAGVAEMLTGTGFLETFEGVPFDNNGWVILRPFFSSSGGWQQSEIKSRSATHSLFVDSSLSSNDTRLISPEFAVTTGTKLRFYQIFTGTQRIELNYSIRANNHFNPTDIPASAITGFPASPSTMQLVEIDLGSFAAGQQVKIYWNSTQPSPTQYQQDPRGWYIDDVSVQDVDDGGADLSNLVVNTTPLTPAFATLTTTYTGAVVPNATTSVTVRPTVKKAGATLQVRVNGGSFSSVASGLNSGALALNSAANNVIEVKVTAQDGIRTKTYTVNVFRDGLPRIKVTGGSNTDIVSQDFGLLSLFKQTTRSFTIFNTGDGTLNVSQVQITGHTGDFVLSSSTPTTIAPGSNAGFSVTFSPQALGNRSAVLRITSNANNTPNYQFTLTGQGGQPEIGISWRGANLPAGTTVPTREQGTDYGIIGTTSSTVRTFTITNTGNTPLLFTGLPKIQISGSNAFFFGSLPPDSIAPGGSGSFTIGFSPSGTAEYTATIRLLNDDLDEGDYTFIVRGRGAGPTVLWSDTFDAAGGFGVAGWTHYAINGTQDWTHVSGGGSTYWSNPSTGDWGDRALVSPAINVLPGTRLAFIHRYNLDSTYCGVVLEYSSDGGRSWLPVPEESMKNAGYDKMLAYGSVLEGRRGWTGSTGNNVPPEEVDLGSFADGKTIHVRWHAADNFYRSVTGFYHMDSVSLSNLNFGSVADLAGLAITTNTPTQPPPNTSLVVLDKPFNNLVTSYSGTVTSSPTIRLNARLADNTATMQGSVNGGAYFALENGVTSAAQLINPGYNTVDVLVTAADLSTKSYTVSLFRATAPDIYLSGNSVPITSGDTTPSVDDGTDFGPTSLNTQVTRTFTVRNIGGGPLNLGGISPVTVSPSTYFTVTSQPVSSQLASGAELEFTIGFTPTANGPAPEATVTVNSDDHDETSFTFKIGGFGGVPNNNADLSNIVLGTGTLAPSFTAANISYLASSTASSTVITTTTADANASVVIRPDQGAAAPSGSTFSLANGSNYYEIVVTAEDKVTKRSYYLNVMRVAPPEINLSANGQNILSGDTSPSPADFTDFGNTVASGSTDRSFRINNTGAGPLLISNVTITGSPDFSLAVPPVSNISSNGQTSFTIRFSPTTLGQKNATVTITNNDSDEGTYTFAIAGNGFVPSSNADLASLGVRGFSTSPGFNASNLVYSAAIPSTTASVTVDAVPADSGANVIVRMTGAIDRAPGVPVDVNFGANRFDVIVTAADGIATRTYTLTVNRNGPPEIAVTGNDQLIPSQDTTPTSGDFTSFGNVDVSAGNVIRSFSIANTGTGPLALGAVTVTGSADFVLTTPPALTVAPGASTSFQIRFDPTDVGLKTAVVTIPNDDSDEAPYTFTINGSGTVVVPTSPDIAVRFNSVDIPHGNLIPTDFGGVNASSGTSTRTFVIANTGTSSLNLTGTPRVQVSGANAGDFVVTAPPIGSTIAAGGQLTFIVTFDPASVGTRTATIVIPNDDPDEAPFTFAVSGSGTAPSITPPSVTKSSSATSYTIDVTADGSWSVFEGLTWASVSAASGTGSASLTVSLLANNTATSRTGTITIAGATHTITQNGIAIPTIDALSASYDTMVGLAFSLPIIAQNPPFTFTASGMPPGLRIGTDGIITGQATTAGTYNVTVRATNIAGNGSASFSIVVAPFPASINGTWTGLVQRIPTPQLGPVGDLGARVEFTSTGNGAVTGRLIEGITPRTFTGQLSLVDASTASLSVLIPGTAATLNLTIDTNNAASGTLDTSGASAAVEAWRKIWTSTNTAAAYAARHNFALANNSGQGPEGYGYGSFTVTASTGALTLSGKLAEGTAITGSTFMGPNGEVLVYQSLYVNKGTVHGKLVVDANGLAVADNTINGTLTWSKPATATSANLYRDGFGPIDLEVAGGTYVRPAAGQRLLDVPAAVAPNTNARLAFDLGGVTPFDQSLRITNPSPTGLSNTIAMATPNPNAVTITSLDTATGLFAGRFTLKGPTSALNRTVSFTGQITTTPSGPAGMGYFILPQLPVAPATLATSPRLSGSVIMEP